MATSIGFADFVTILTLCLCLSAVNCWIPRVINGRPKGGMLGAPKDPLGVKTPPAQLFSQRLDHFNGADFRSWKQRFFVNDTFFKENGPVFVMIGGEGPANPKWMVEGTWIEFAKMYGAICVMLEHRYYGESHPVEDLSLGNLKYLSSRQALADLANFIDWFKNNGYPSRVLTNSKVITFGGSYPGSLSAWFRSKYPYMVDGAVATSAPIYAQLDFKEYLSVVTDALATTGPKCNEEIKNATSTMYEWWGQRDKRPQLESMFQLCDKINQSNKLDLYGFFANTAGNFENVVQYNKDNRAFEGAIGTDITLDTLCGIMTDFTCGTPIQRYADVNTLILNTYSQKCLDYTYDNLIKDMRQTDWTSDAGEGGRQWMYQTCAEFGWYQSADYSNQPFGPSYTNPVEYSIQQCSDIYDQVFTMDNIAKNVAETNRYYGGRDIPVTKVVFPNGSIDPWHAMGVTKDISSEATAVYINGTAHCANMYPAREFDLPELVAARKHIGDLINKWIQ